MNFVSLSIGIAMKKLKSALWAGTLSLAFGLVPTIPSVAVPITSIPHVSGNSDIQNVQHRRHGHWRGHRGVRHRRPGYRRHSDGLWYPLAAFGLGAIIGGAMASQPPARPVYRQRVLSNAHIQWCYSKYRSYRTSDNTFQPYNGPRRQCLSPY